jgi:hypothetical protein
MGFDTEESEVEELVLYATTSSEPVYKAMRQAAFALGKRQYQGTYEEPKALILMKHIADLAAREYAKEFGTGRQNPRAAAARELLRRWVQPHIDVDIKPELEAKYGRKPVSGGGHGLPDPRRLGPSPEERIYQQRRERHAAVVRGMTRGVPSNTNRNRFLEADDQRRAEHARLRPADEARAGERGAPPPPPSHGKKKRLGRAELKAAVRGVAPHFFDPETMRHFNSRLESDGYVGRDGYIYFVTSEMFEPSEGPAHPRQYKVRRVTAVGVRTVDTVKDKSAAVDLAKQLANEG